MKTRLIVVALLALVAGYFWLSAREALEKEKCMSIGGQWGVEEGTCSV